MAEAVSRRSLFPGPPIAMSWGSIFGGAVAALAIWLLLYTLGVALGLSVVDPNDPGSLRSSGIFTGIWSAITPLIALFVGGVVASRGAGVVTRAGGALHGLVMWSITTLAGVWLLTSVLASVAGGVAQFGGRALGVGGEAISQSQAAGTFGLDANAVVEPINEQLRAQGRPEITADELRAATRDALGDAVRTGKLDRETLTQSLADKTDLSYEDARVAAAQVERQFDQWKQSTSEKLAQVGQQAKHKAMKAAKTTGKVFWGAFGALALGLISAILGSLLGVSRRQRMWADEPPPGSWVDEDTYAAQREAARRDAETQGAARREAMIERDEDLRRDAEARRAEIRREVQARRDDEQRRDPPPITRRR